MVTVEIADGGTTVATVTIDGTVPGLFVVDAVARLAVAARRLGWSLRVVDGETCALLGLAGLPTEYGREAERREQRRVEEVVQPDQPPA